jgi:hypothetical protein
MAYAYVSIFYKGLSLPAAKELAEIDRLTTPFASLTVYLTLYNNIYVCGSPEAT